MLNLRKLREKKGLTQVECAAALGITQSAYSNWELGARTPMADRLPAIAALLDCTIDELYTHDPASTA